MTNKFKVGDKVKLKDGYSSLKFTTDDLLEVDKYNSELDHILVIKRDCWTNASAFELLDRIESKYLRWHHEQYPNQPLNLTIKSLYKVMGNCGGMVKIIDDKGEDYMTYERYFLTVNSSNIGEEMPEDIKIHIEGHIEKALIADNKCDDKFNEINKLEQQIKVMKDYLIMNLERNDFHSLWDASIDLQRLWDKLQWIKES